MPISDKQFSTGRAPKDAQMRALQKVQGWTDRSKVPGPDIRDPDPPKRPGPTDMPSNQTASDGK